jgi:diamine N-acetyltransferase
VEVTTLRDVTAENVRPICELELRDGQTRFVAPPAVTIAEAHYQDEAILRAIYAGDELVGLAAIAHEDGEWWLWRLMIDRRRQREGHGSAALALIAELMGERGADEMFTSYVPGEGDPSGFYARAGFEETGRVEHGERVLRLLLKR